MAKALVGDELWAKVRPLLPGHKPSPRGGRPRVPDRVCLAGIVFVLRTGIPWEDFPREMGCCGMTLHNRLRQWHAAGAWDALHRLLLSELRGADRIDFSRVVVDSSSVRAVHGGGGKTGPSPVDRAKPGSKHHLATDAAGVPLAAALTGANRNDVTRLVPLVEAIPPVGGKAGAPRRRPGLAVADRGDDHDRHRGLLAARNIPTLIARRRTPHGSGLGRWRWVVEQTLALLHQFRRLRTRFDRRADVHEAFLSLGCCLICWRRLNREYF